MPEFLSEGDGEEVEVPNMLNNNSTEKGFGKIMADLIADNPLKGIPFLKSNQQSTESSAEQSKNQTKNIASSTLMDLDETPKDLVADEYDKVFNSSFEKFDQPLRMPIEATQPEEKVENRLSNPYLYNSPPVEKEEFSSLDKFDVEEPSDKEKDKEENFGKKTVKVAGEVKDAVINHKLV